MEAQETLAALLARTRAIDLEETPRLAPFATIRRFQKGLICRLDAR